MVHLQWKSVVWLWTLYLVFCFVNTFYSSVVEKTRVLLSGHGDNDYINANHVKVVCLLIQWSVNAIILIMLIEVFFPTMFNLWWNIMPSNIALQRVWTTSDYNGWQKRWDLLSARLISFLYNTAKGEKGWFIIYTEFEVR